MVQAIEALNHKFTRQRPILQFLYCSAGIFIRHLRDRVRLALPPDEKRTGTIFTLPSQQWLAINWTAKLGCWFVEIKHAHTSLLALIDLRHYHSKAEASALWV
jgi:hypothetical protein